MAEIRETPRPIRAALERLCAQVPGFRGYLAREERRDSDRRLRERCAARLDGVIGELSAGLARAPVEERGAQQELVTQVERLRAELQFADRSYSAFFDDAELAADAALDAVYAQDERVVLQVDEIAAQLDDAEFSPGKLRGSVRRLGLALADRRNAILRLHSR
jgi:hypothetical protein